MSSELLVTLKHGKFHEVVKLGMSDIEKWECLHVNWDKFSLTGEGEATHFYCFSCHGKNHKEHLSEASLEVKHFLHPKHSLQIVYLVNSTTRECYCCDESMKHLVYCCLPCDFAMKIACVEKPPVLSIDHPKWHEHTLALFPRHASLTCNLCALPDLSSPTYMCPPCDFVVHLRCLSLPRLIRISRHLHRITFTPSFDQGDWFCHVCRRKIDNDYGGYTCIKDGCLYVAHSRCATQSNVWDGIELEGEPEEIEEELEPFVRISDGVIQHFSHQHLHLSLDENTDRDYDEDRLCQACTMPIYFGNFYSCMQCDYILHETCANISRKMLHPIHPHLLTLVTGHVGGQDFENKCSACCWKCITGFIYKCSKEGCEFKLHVQCARVSEPLVHESHNIHPLYLTSKPGEHRTCSICKEPEKLFSTNETFNCIECDFALCFDCATVPQKVRYKHDKHILILSYEKEKDTMTYWCEICEKEIHSDEHFYMCDESCCVTLHKECLLGWDLYIRPGLSWFSKSRKVCVLSNNHHMSRPICSNCEKRCPHKIAFQRSGLVYCSLRASIANFLKWDS